MGESVPKEDKDKSRKVENDFLAKKERGWIKFVRFLVYVVSIIGVTVGASLIKAGGLSAAYADGTYAAKIDNGEVIFFTSLLILCGNIMWGILRWFLRGYREKWKPGRLIGKLIGGGIWRMLLIIPLVLFSFLAIVPKVSDIISLRVAEEQDNQKGISLSEPLDQLEYISEHLENYTFEELEEELAPYLLKNIDFGVDASSNISKNQSTGIFTQNVSAYTPDVILLNKAKLSSGGHFVIFYTDTGSDKISDDEADRLAEMLEMIVEKYKEILGFDYSYEKIDASESFWKQIYQGVMQTPDFVQGVKSARMMQVLANSGIDMYATNYAMPVYVANPFSTDSETLASYAGTRWLGILEDLGKKLGGPLLEFMGVVFDEDDTKETGDNLMFYESVPSFPFINILPANISSESLPIVAAHELGHHYVANYNYEHYGNIGSDDDFIDETAPNWMAINVLPNQSPNNLINNNHYKNKYLSDATSVKISDAAPDFLGYPAVAFLENYYEIVPNAKTIIMDAVYYGDALSYLYDKAGRENFHKVMVGLAEKNLTGDYDGKLMNYEETRRGKKYTLPKGEELQCTDLCTKEYSINPAATGYLYFAVDEYRGAKLKFSGLGDATVSVLGRDASNQWHIIQSDKSETEFEFADEMAEEYGVVAFAIANSNIISSGKYEIGITSVEFEGLIDVAGGFDFEGLYTDLGQGCFEVDFDSLFDLYGQLIDLGEAVMDTIAGVGDTTDYSDLQNEWNEDANEARINIEEARQSVSKYEISVCANYIVDGQTFDQAREVLRKTMGWNMTLYDKKDGSNRISVFSGFNLLTQQGKIYVLAESDGEMGLVTINVSEK